MRPTIASMANLTKPVACGLVILSIVVLLAGCSVGAPTVASDPTASVPPGASSTKTNLASPLASPTAAVAESTESPTAQPSATKAASVRTPRPTRTPTEGPTPRPAPPPDDGSGLSQIFERGTSGRREVALTFDAGADRGYAEQILDTLADYGVKASFGMTGHWAEENPDLVKRIVADGHMVFNHTWNHRSFTGFSTADFDEGVTTREERQKELADTEEFILDLTAYDVAPYFRPPYGDLDDSVLADVADAGYWITVMWTCDSFGWNGASVDQIVEKCGDNASPGDIILLHVGSDSLDTDALPGLIESLRDQNLTFVTVEELLQD